MCIVIATSTICSECSPKRARAVVRELCVLGWAARYGEVTDIPDDAAFSVDFYKANEIVDQGKITPA